MTNIKHLAIIMDGNRRWAKKRLLPVSYGHRKGGESVQLVIKHALANNIKHLTLYAFSSENWSRPKDQVDNIMEFLVEYIDKHLDTLNHHKIRINIMGKSAGLPEDVQTRLAKCTDMTLNNDKLILNVAINYSGQDEIIHAINLTCKTTTQPITKNDIQSNLYSNSPMPDIILRTAGEKRLSDFMIWQAAFAELMFTDTLWPDFNEEDFAKIIAEYDKRNRTFGK